MSVSSDLLNGACYGFQTSLIKNCALSGVPKFGTTVGILKMSELYNPFGVDGGFSNDGYDRSIKVRYMPRTVDDGDYSGIKNICDMNAPNVLYNSITITPEHSTSVEKKFAYNDLRILCDTPEQFQASVINGMMSAMMKKINYINLAYIDTITPYLINHGAGQYNADLIAGTSPNEQVDHRVLRATIRNLEDIGCGDTPFWVGQSEELDLTAEKLRVGCCNNNGLDLSQVNGQFIYFRDNQVNAVLGSGHSLIMAPGSMVILPWLQNKGAWAESGDDSMKYGTVFEPLTGLEMDLNINYDKCTRLYEIQLALHWHLWTVPADYYETGDELFETKAFLRPVLV